MQKESETTWIETHKLRFYRVKVDNVIRVTSEEGIALGAKSEMFGRILQEVTVLSSDMITRFGEGNDRDFLEREKDSQTIKSLTSQRDV